MMQFMRPKYPKCHLANMILSDVKLMILYIACIVLFLHKEEKYYSWIIFAYNNG